MPIKPTPPTLTPAQERDAQEAFTREVERDLVIRGESLTDENIRTAMAEVRRSLVVRSTMTGPEVRAGSWAQSPASARAEADLVMQRVQEQRAIQQWGPDVARVVAERLVVLGVPEAEAKTLAASRVRRFPDGRVEAYDTDRKVIAMHRPISSRQKADGSEELLAGDALVIANHPARVLTDITRAILEDRDKSKAAPNSVPSHAERVASAF